MCIRDRVREQTRQTPEQETMQAKGFNHRFRESPKFDLEPLQEFPDEESSEKEEKEGNILFQNEQLSREFEKGAVNIKTESMDFQKTHQFSDGVFNDNLEKLFLKSVEHEHQQLFIQKNRILGKHK